MNQQNKETLEKIYNKLSSGDIDGMLALCGDNITFSIPGKSKLAGRFTKANFKSSVIDLQRELSAGTFKIDAHDIMASERHGTVLNTQSMTRSGSKIEHRSVHVWRFENGKPIAFYEYTRDLYDFDAAWNS